MEIEIPAISAGVMILLNFFAPYATSLIIDVEWSPAAKKWAAIGVAVLLSSVVLLISYFGFGIPIPSWHVLLLTGVATSQAAYDLILKKSADRLAALTSASSKTR